MAIDVREKSPEEIARFVSDKFEEFKDQDCRTLLKEKHGENVGKVESAFDLLTEWIRSTVLKGHDIEEFQGRLRRN
jgi:hypothetical protein